MGLEKQVETLRKLIEARGADTKDKRRHIYDQLMLSLEKKYAADSDVKSALRSRLETAVQILERDFTMTDKSASVTAGLANPAATSSKSSGNKRILVAAFVVLAAAAAFTAAGGWSKLFGGDPFALELSNFRALPAVAATIGVDNPNYAIGEFEGKPTLVIKGQGAVATETAIAVDIAKSYVMEVRLRVSKDDPALPSLPVSAGVATFNAAGELELDPPGAHRYFLAVAKPLTQADGTVTLTGTITGTGNDSYSSFRPGTKSVRPIVVANGSSKVGETEIISVSFKESEAK